MKKFLFIFFLLLLILLSSSCLNKFISQSEKLISFSQNGDLFLKKDFYIQNIELVDINSKEIIISETINQDRSIQIKKNLFYNLNIYKKEKNDKKILYKKYEVGIFDSETILPFIEFNGSKYRVHKQIFGDEIFYYGIIHQTYPQEELYLYLIFDKDTSLYECDYSGSYDKNIFFSSKLIIPVEIKNLSAKYVNLEVEYKFRDKDPYTANINTPFILKNDSETDGYIYPVSFDLKNNVMYYNPNFIRIEFLSTENYEPYSELWKMKLDEANMNKRDFDKKVNNINKISTNKKNAIIMVSGHQGSVKNETDDYSFWRNEGRQWTWKVMYSLAEEDSFFTNNFDYYEFITDTYFQSVKEAGESLAKIIYEGKLLDKYDNIYLIGHSLGALTIRYASNEIIPGDKKLGSFDQIKKIITINGINHGSVLQSASSILINLEKIKNLGKVYSLNLSDFKNFGADYDSLLYLGYTIYFSKLFDKDFKETLLSQTFSCYFSNLLEEAILEYPLFISILVETKNIDPFECGRSGMYDNREYIDEINDKLFNGSEIFINNENLKKFNENYEFYDKMLTVNSLVNEEIDLEEAYRDGYFNCLSIRLMDSFLKTLSNEKNKKTYLSDGVSNYYSQRASEQTEELYFDNLDHLQTMLSKEVLNNVLKKIKYYSLSD